MSQAVIDKPLNYSSFENKLGSWAPYFKEFIEDPEGMIKIYENIRNDSQKEVIVPKSDVTFRAFSTCRKEDLSVIFYLMDPYPRMYRTKETQATGIALDCSNSPDGKIQPSLIHWYNALDKEYGKSFERSPDLSYLHEQGIMLLNTDLTCKLGKTSSHEGVWRSFQKYFLETVMRSETGIVYVLCGKSSHKLEEFINPLGNYIFKISHPNAAEHSRTDWDTDGVFKKIDRILWENNKKRIFWNRKDWEEYKEPPF